jgi:hypothetical protein
MKWKPLIVIFLVLISCTDDQPASKNGALIPVKKDTAVINNHIANPFAPLDISPVDISYFPVDYPVRKMSQPSIGMPVVRVIYSRPHKQGRKIFGALLPYNEPWRLGANEATEIEFFQPVRIQNKLIEKGRYVMYSIPNAGHWTIVFNSNIYSWGLKPDPKQDIHRFRIRAEAAPAVVESYTMVFEKSETGANLIMAWDDVVATLPISL